MLGSSLRSALLTIRRRPVFSLINVFGLAVGIASCVLILLFVQDELRYDRHHPNADRLYRVALERSFPERTASYAIAPMPVAPTLLQDYPEVEAATQVTETLPQAVRHGDVSFQEEGILFADSAFFDVFNVEPIEGDADGLLAAPNSIVVTPEMARKYFGDDDPIGRELVLDFGSYTVTGVVPPMPEHTHFHYDFIARMNLPWLDESDWLEPAATPYILLRPDADPAALEARIPEMVERYAGDQIRQELGVSLSEYRAAGNAFRYFLQPVTDIHLHSNLEYEFEANGSIVYVRLFSVVALVILLIACVNFTNLSTAQAFGRAREVGVRKALGSGRGDLIGRFLFESLVVAFVALGVAVVLVVALLPFFNDMTGKSLSAGLLLRGQFLAGLVGVAIVTGLASGSYPAFFLSGFRPVAVLKGRLGPVGADGSANRLRSSLVVVQFTLSIALLIGAGVVSEQMDFMFGKDLGFDKAQQVVIERTGPLENRQLSFMDELRTHPGIESASRSNGIPGLNFFAITVIPVEPGPAPITGRFVYSDDTYMETYGLELVAGRNFSRDRAADSTAVIVNETMAAELAGGAVNGSGVGSVVGSEITIPGDRRGGDVRHTVVGVMRDFHHESLHAPIGPVLLRHDQGPRYPMITARIAAGSSVPAALGHLEATWNRFVPDEPLNTFFFDRHFDALYDAEIRTSRVLDVFMVLSILLACLGLLGLSAFAAARRTKEIGIRKVLGAGVANIVVLLTKEFMQLVIVSFVLAVPLTWYVMNDWLQDFAYRIEPGAGVFLWGGLVTLVVALVTVNSQALRAALADPVRSIREE